jgi:hypothetical protein
MFTEAPASQPKLTEGFGHHVFEGEDDAFLWKRIKETHVHRSLNITPENCASPIPMWEGDAFGRISPH